MLNVGTQVISFQLCVASRDASLQHTEQRFKVLDFLNKRFFKNTILL